MKRILEISASFTGTIATGSYENSKPFYSVKEIIELDEFESGTHSIIRSIAERQKELHDICYNQFKRQAEASLTERIAKEYKNIRFYEGANGLKYPSVTSIIGWDKDFFISKEDLQQHASRGTIIDRQVGIYLQTGKWKEPKEIPEIYPDLVIVKKGSLNLDLTNANFIGFYKKYPFKLIDQQKKSINHEHRYGGTREICCIIESSNKGGWDKIEGTLFDVPTLLDLKCTTSLDKNYVMKQNTAYAKCDESIKQIGVIHLKKDNACGYAKPVLERNLDKYWSLFLDDQIKFNKRYGL